MIKIKKKKRRLFFFTFTRNERDFNRISFAFFPQSTFDLYPFVLAQFLLHTHLDLRLGPHPEPYLSRTTAVGKFT